MEKEFSICYASSNEYAQYTGISMLSLLENNADIIDKIFLLSFGIEQNNIKQISRITSIYGTELIIIDAIGKMQKLFKSLDLQLFEGSYATYARAFIEKIIEDYDGMVLYIDSDTIVDGSLLPLRELDLGRMGKAYGAIIGMNQYVYPYEEINLDNGNKKYYACGVLLFDMKSWKNNKCTDWIISYIRSKENKNFKYADQTVINNCIPEKLALPLNLEFNYWGHMFRGRRIIYELTRGGFYSKEQVEYAINNPVIIHYKGYIVHPWLKGNASSLASRYQYYKKKSPWANVEEKTIYYSEKEKCETAQQRKKMKQTMRYLRRPAFYAYLFEKLVEIKHRIID